MGNEYKLRIKDRVKKVKGYTFEGVVVARYKVEGGTRYDVQIDGEASVARLNKMMKAGTVKINSAKVLIELEEMLMNCHGMIHIFAEEQLTNV